MRWRRWRIIPQSKMRSCWRDSSPMGENCMKKAASVLSIVAALGVGFGGGYLARGSVAPDLVRASAPEPAAISRSVPEDSTFSTPSPKPAPRATAAPRATTAPRATATPRVTAAPRPASTPSTYIINKNSRVFHRPNCSSVKQMSEKNKKTVTQVRREDLMEDGYQRCTRCQP